MKMEKISCDRGTKMQMGMTGIWKDMRDTYRKMGLSEEEITERMLCKITRSIERKNKLDECDEK